MYYRIIEHMVRTLHCIGFLILLTTLGPHPVAAQLNKVPIEELTDSMRLHPKPALILLTADWCAYCHLQRAQLKKSTKLQRMMATVYFSEVDTEMRQTLVFNGKTYRFLPTGVGTGSHELAFALGAIDNRLALPTWIVLNEHFEIIFKFAGVIKTDELLGLLETIHRPPLP